MIKVCDAIMGTGKSSAAISYMNEHPNDKFIYITPYLEEASRIRNGCPSLRFIEPSNNIPEFDYQKTKHTAALIKQGRNITTTHQAFSRYNADMLNDIREHEYTLIVDENLDVLEAFDIHPADLQLAIDAGYIREDGDFYSISNPDYKGVAFRELFSLLKSRELFKMTSVEDNNTLFYWVLPPELITAFKDVFVLTYLFGGQSIHYFLDMYRIPYEFVGIEKTGENEYRFCDFPGYVPEYVQNLDKMLHVCDNLKMNSIGDDPYALSKNWFKKGVGVDQLKRNIYNFFFNMNRETPADLKMCGVFKDFESTLKGKGYSKSFVTFNARATNKYKDRICLAYMPNIFMNVNEKQFYQKHGIEVDEDTFALSIMIQWIWRSAIRDGDEINLYIPSKRMRELLLNWIETTKNGGR